MKQPYIQSNNRTNWSSLKETVSQPKGINYESLAENVAKSDKRIQKENSVVRKDLRITSAIGDNYSHELDKNDEINKLDSKSIIPIPGVMFDNLENNQGYSGKTPNWNDTTNNQLTNGPQWNPMTF